MGRDSLVTIESLFDGVNTVDELKERVLTLEQPEIETLHEFKDGKYYRTFFPKQDTLVIGKIHRKAGFNMLVQGGVTIYDGENTRVFHAPHLWEAPADVQKVGLFHQDSIFLSIFDTDAVGVENAEEELYYPDETKIETVNDWNCYKNTVKILGVTEDYIQKRVNMDNVIEHYSIKDYELKESIIHGTGLFTTIPYKKGELIGYALVDGKRTVLGRWVNESATPNMVGDSTKKNNGLVYAHRDIEAGEELTSSYLQNLETQKETS